MVNILLYDDHKTQLRTPYLRHALERDLNLKNIQFNHADRHHLTAAMNKNTDAVFIAENIGSKCHHMRDIPSSAIKAMKQYAYDGGQLIFFGGMAHYAMSEITWHWDNETIVYKGMKQTFSFVHGQMVGPHHRFPISPDDPIEHNGCFEVPLIIPEGETEFALENCWQGNCGNFIINEDRIHHDYDVLATYAQKEGVAALKTSVGHNGGNIILCSVMPHYRKRHASPLWNKILSHIEEKTLEKTPTYTLKQTP